MSHPNDELIQRFYEAFNRQDGDTMAACYKPDAHFRDPVFGNLSGVEAGDMWRMLTSRGGDLTIDLAEHQANDTSGSANWIAHYTFTQTGRKVINDIQARFRFEGGLFSEHIDEFSFWTWSRQALGPAGALLGWTPILRNKVSSQANASLAEFRAAT